MDDFYELIKSWPMWVTSREMLMPGELEYRTEIKRKQEGIALPQELVVEINELAKNLGIDSQL
jgi:LDH2 family malate/lactate/ureidoglycolate dehydrogenase